MTTHEQNRQGYKALAADSVLKITQKYKTNQ